jgi:DNA-binding transcriptional LysR family regulator
MEFRQLKAFAETAQAGSITAAAKVLRVTQPALSRQIKALEEELEVALFVRGAHSVTLTPAGEILRGEVSKLLKFCDGMVAKVRAEGSCEPLRIGYSPSLAGEFLSVAIERFAQLHERVRVSLYDWSSAEMRAGLADGKLDLILAVPCEGEPVRWEPLREFGWRVLLPASHPLAAKKKLSPADLDGQRLLLFEKENYPDYWNQITGYFRERGLQAKVAGEYDGISSLKAAVEGGLGLALVAETSRIEGNRRLALRALGDSPAPIRVAAGLPAGREIPARVLAFVEELRRAAGEG